MISDSAILKKLFNKNYLSELDQYEKVYLIFLAINDFYHYEAEKIIKELLKIGEEGKSSASVILGFQTLGGGWEIFKNAQAIALTLQKYTMELVKSRKLAYAETFTRHYNSFLYQRGKIGAIKR